MLFRSLFLPEVAGGLLCAPGVREVSGRVLGMLLSKRFDFHGAEAQGVFESLEAYLLALARRLDDEEFAVGRVFSMADLALAAMLRPLTIVPFFAEHPQLQTLFARQRDVLQRHSPEGDLLYQQAIACARQRRAPVRRRLNGNPTPATPSASLTPELQSHLPVHLPGHPQVYSPGPLTVRRGATMAANDQRNIWDAGMWAMPFHYFYTLRLGKVRQTLASAGVR